MSPYIFNSILQCFLHGSYLIDERTVLFLVPDNSVPDMEGSVSVGKALLPTCDAILFAQVDFSESYDVDFDNLKIVSSYRTDDGVNWKFITGTLSEPYIMTLVGSIKKAIETIN